MDLIKTEMKTGAFTKDDFQKPHVTPMSHTKQIINEDDSYNRKTIGKVHCHQKHYHYHYKNT